LRIGGGHGNGFAAYGQLVYADVLRAVQSDPALTKGKFSIRFQVTVAPDGRIEAVKFESGSGDPRLDAALEQLLTRLTLSQHPPGGLPPVRIEINSRPSL
jgi:TonB family protein